MWFPFHSQYSYYSDGTNYSQFTTGLQNKQADVDKVPTPAYHWFMLLFNSL